MLYIFAAFLWPVGAVAIYFLQPMLLPGSTPPKPEFLALVALGGMAAFTFAGVLRMLGYLRDDKKRRSKAREDAGSDGAAGPDGS